MVCFCEVDTANEHRSRPFVPIVCDEIAKTRVDNVTIDPRTPVLVGQAQVAQHEEIIANARGPIELMTQAVSDAAVDAGIAELGNASVIRVIRSLSTREPNPARSIARALGISANRYAYTPHGGNLPQTLVNTSALEIQRGDADLIILTGGETTRSRRRARNAEQNLAWMSASTQSEGDDAPEIDGEDLMLSLIHISEPTRPY